MAPRSQRFLFSIRLFASSAAVSLYFKLQLAPPFFGMAEQLDEESQMRAARAEIMAVSDMFHR
jgi:hypothetical protein